MSHSSSVPSYGLVFMGAGAAIFIKGWRTLRRKRLIDDVPSSKIGSVAMGLCELSGLAVAERPITAEFTGRSAVWRRLRITRGSGKSNTTLLETRSAEPFKIDDGTGWALVVPAKAQIEAIEPRGWRGYYRSADPACRELIDQHNSAWSGEVKTLEYYTIEEWAIETGQSIFVLGCANPPEQHAAAGCRAVIARDPREGVMILSTASKRRLEEELGGSAVACLFGGPALFLAGLAALLLTLR